MSGVRLLYMLIFLSCTGIVSGQDCRPHNDSMVLVDFFGATKGTSWKVKWNMNNEVGAWHGINVNQSGCVTSIILSDNGLQGSIPDLDLPFLEKMDVSNNNMLSTLPAFSKVTKLKHLNVSNNRFQGLLPPLENSPNMEIILANNNQLKGSIPDYSHMTELQSLNLAENQLTGTIEFISGYPLLTYLNLSNNLFMGSIPDMTGHSGLTEMDLSKNNFTGMLPDIDGLSQLSKVNVSENQLTGSFQWPENVSVLEELRISHNKLSDTIPNTGPVGMLELFHASDNQFTGQVPDMELPELRELLLSQNILTGSIPEFQNLPSLEQFSVRLNELDNVDFGPDLLDRIAFADVSENRLTFQDVIPFRNYRGSSIVLFPQKNVHFSPNSFTVTKGNNYTIELNTDEDHQNTDYQWYKDGSRLDFSTGKNFFISNSIPKDAGEYTVVMTNSRFSGFPILSDPFTLLVDCPQVIEERKVYLCPGDIFPYKGTFYSTDTMFADTVYSQNDFVCDSLYLYTIETYEPDTVLTESVLCRGETYYFGPDSIKLTQSGSYVDTFPNLGGCDSIVTLDLKFRPVYVEVRDVGLCPGDSFRMNDTIYYTDVDLLDTLTSVYGCDSIVTLQVRFSDPVTTVSRYDLCEGDSLMIDGQYYTSSVSWTDTLSARAGCDSISTVQVSVHESYEETINVKLCSPETYEWMGRQLSSSGQFSDTLRSIYGCDSIVHLNLNVAPSYFSRDTMFICQGDSVFFNGSWLTGPGIYFSDETSVTGCDSVDVLEISLNDYAQRTIKQDICPGDTLVLNDKIYTETGVYKDTLFSEESCDTLLSIEVGVSELVLTDSMIIGTGTTDSTGSLAVEVTGGRAPYNFEWNTGDTTSVLDSVAAGDYMVMVTDSIGCMATFTLTVPVMTFVWQPVEKKSWIRIRPNYLDRSHRSSVYLDVQEGMRGSKISLFNEIGQEMDRKTYNVLESGQSLLWELGSVPAGVYYFHIREEGHPAFQVERVVVF